MFYIFGKEADVENKGRPPYFKYINCIPFLQGSHFREQTWSTCSGWCGNVWGPLRDACVNNAGTVDFEYSYIRVGALGTDNQVMTNCSYGGEAVTEFNSPQFAVDTMLLNQRRYLAMDDIIAYSTGTRGEPDGPRKQPWDVYWRWLSEERDEPREQALELYQTGGALIAKIQNMSGNFGSSVAQKDGVVAVGAFLDGYKTGVGADQADPPIGSFGKVYIYDTGGNLRNTIEPPEANAPGGAGTVFSPGPSGARGFGMSVDLLNSELVLIGAPYTSGYYWQVDGGNALQSGWTNDAGAAYVYTTGGSLLHTVTGHIDWSEHPVSSYGPGSEWMQKFRKLGWQGAVNETSMAIGGPGYMDFLQGTVDRQQLDFYTTGGAWHNTIGFKYDSSWSHPDIEWYLFPFNVASNSQGFFVPQFWTDYTKPLGVGAQILNFDNNGTKRSHVNLPASASIYSATSMDASEEYLLLGDIGFDPVLGIEGPPSGGKLYIMQTGDLFLKEVPSPDMLPMFGVQVATNDKNYIAMNASGIVNYSLSGSLPFSTFTGFVGNAFDEWKGVFESAFDGVTLNFVNLGLEAGISIPSNTSGGSYALTSDVGNIRLGMESGIGHPSLAYCPGGVMNVSGEIGGDIHLARYSGWRKDATDPADAVPNAYSIEYVCAQAIGTALGFGKNTNPDSLMYPTFAPAATFSDRFPNGLSGSTDEMDAVFGLYGVKLS